MMHAAWSLKEVWVWSVKEYILQLPFFGLFLIRLPPSLNAHVCIAKAYKSNFCSVPMHYGQHCFLQSRMICVPHFHRSKLRLLAYFRKISSGIKKHSAVLR